VAATPLDETPGWHDLAPADRVEVVRFSTFLGHHGPPGALKPAGSMCSCGKPSVRQGEGGQLTSVRNDDCPCPCHEPGYVLGTADAALGGATR
jgi:hypothetical protein